MNRLFTEDFSNGQVTAPPFHGPLPQSASPAPARVHPMAAQPPGLNLGDIYYIVFRHKWKILLCTLAGFAAAAATYTFKAPPFQSEAKLFVRYIVSENKALGPASHDSTAAKSPDQRGETIMKSEAEILSSLDLAKQVVDSIGAERILARFGGGKDATSALGVIKGNPGGKENAMKFI
ncbi:MAG: Wzz/FepE/Etk N-terminal domain-containing protein, partial [Verrucomicrobiota bacterium]